jgi:aminoglycoside phosphotransferase (APT) family kinase protein
LQTEDPVFLHHDFWAGNTLWQDDRLVAVIDWEGGCLGDPAVDVAYCAFDMRLLGMDVAAEHLIRVYRELSGRSLVNLEYWEIASLYRPMPDVGMWVPSWNAMGLDVDVDRIRDRHTSMILAALSLS